MQSVASIRRHAEEAHRDPDTIGLQSMVATPPKDPEGKRFYAEHDQCPKHKPLEPCG